MIENCLSALRIYTKDSCLVVELARIKFALELLLDVEDEEFRDQDAVNSSSKGHIATSHNEDNVEM